MGNKSNNSKSNKKIVKGIDAVGHVARDNLERLGSLLDSLNAKSGKASQFKAVDLSNYETGNASNLLSQQTIKTSQQLLGSRYAKYGKYAKKVVPDSIFQKATDSVFSQVAKLAASWSEIDLPSEHRFEGIQGLDDQQRNALARDIANQNRALATIGGGVSGLAGLPGILADTLWLLLVSLRTVYQLATVYDKPLTGKQGVKMAYAVLSHADLSKMQEKQTILAGLGVAQGLLENANNSGLRDELKNMGIGSGNIKFYAEQIDKIADQLNIDIDGINLSWLTRFLPLTSVIVAARYNSHLIDQVIGVANATFGPEPIVAKEAIENKTDENQKKPQEEDVNNSEKDKKQDDSSIKDKNESQDTTKKDILEKNATDKDTTKKNTTKKNTETKKNSSDSKPDSSKSSEDTSKSKNGEKVENTTKDK